MYKRGIDLFCEWYGKDVETILKQRKDDLTPRANETLVDAKQRASRYEKLLEKFHAWLLEYDYKINSARTLCLGVMQLFRYYNMGITLRTGSPVSRTVVTTSDFIMQPEHVRAMFHVAKDLRSKLLISMGNDFGWRISDILSIKRNELPNLEQEPPIEWIRITKKEKVVAKSCLSKTTVALLKEYLFTLPSQNQYLFHSNGQSHISDETVNTRLRDLAREAGIELSNMKLRWHCFRKMIISQAKNLGIDPDVLRLLVGKSVKKDVLTNMTGVDVKTVFNKLQRVLGIKAFTEESEDIVKTMGAKIKGLENAMLQLEHENQNFKTRIDLLQKEVTNLQEDIKGLYLVNCQFPMTVRRILFNKKTKKIEEWDETINTPEELEEANKSFLEKVRKLREDESK